MFAFLQLTTFYAITGSMESKEGWLTARRPQKADDRRKWNMTDRKNIKKLQILSKYRKRYHIYIQWQSRITRKNWDCQEIRIDQHNGYGLRVFRIIKAIKDWWIQSLRRRQLPKDLIGRQTWQKNMRDNTFIKFLYYACVLI